MIDSKSFTGELSAPLQRPSDEKFTLMSVMNADTPEAVAARQEELVSILSHKLDLLCKHYSIDCDDPNRDLLLALALAGDFVPGFQVEAVKPKKGRPTFWTSGRTAALVIQMSYEMRTRNHGARDAAKQLAKRKPWKQLLEQSGAVDDPGEVLRARYQKASANEKRIAEIWIARMQRDPQFEREFVVTNLVALIDE
jgi:hypothetical protein